MILPGGCSRILQTSLIHPSIFSYEGSIHFGLLAFLFFYHTGAQPSFEMQMRTANLSSQNAYLQEKEDKPARPNSFRAVQVAQEAIPTQTDNIYKQNAML